MDLVDSDKEKGVEVKIWKEYQQILNNAEKHQVKLTLIPRFDFYERAKKAYAIIHSG
jgi:L-fucose mutarotase